MKKFFRKDEGSYIGGVCTGLEDYTVIDALLWRIAFIFLCGPNVLAYILLWALAPKKD